MRQRDGEDCARPGGPRARRGLAAAFAIGLSFGVAVAVAAPVLEPAVAWAEPVVVPEVSEVSEVPGAPLEAPLEGVGGDGQIASGSPGPDSAQQAPADARSLAAGTPGAPGVPAAGSRGSLLGDDYPARYRDLPWPYVNNNIWDEWNFAYRQCTSFVAWRLNSANGIPFSNQYGGLYRWGDAGQWAASARSLGIAVDTVPEVGAIAWSGPLYADASFYGHVAWVSQVLDGGYVVIEEYNAGWAGSYGTRTVPWNQFQGYIHVNDIATAFRDVGPGHKFFREIEWMAESGMSTGVKQPAGPPRYMPAASMSREAMAAFLYRLEEPAGFVAPAVSPFADMRPGDKFYREIAWMHASGLSTGIRQPGGLPHYAPKARVTREAMAAFIYRLEQAAAAAPAVSPFGDMNPGYKFFREISWMSSAGLSTGIRQASGLPHYAPKASVSREAMAAFLYRLETQ